MSATQSTAEKQAVFDFIDAVHAAPTFGEVNRLFRRLIAGWGFDRWNCVQVSTSPGLIRQPLRRAFGEPNVAFHQRYREARHIYRDPAVPEVLKRTAAFWWSDVAADPKLSKDQLLVFEEAKEFGAVDGLTVPIRFPDGTVWACLLVGEGPSKTQAVADMGQIAAQFYAGRALYLRDLQKRELAPAGRLTDRQRKLVELLRFGNTQTDIAKMTGLSESTVNNELADARKRLNCSTIAELVAEALLNGEIDTEQQN
jgi:DNA-binding CsgD family transcriptional regulator